MPTKKSKIIDEREAWDKIIEETKKIDGKSVDVGLFGDGQPEQNLAYRGTIQEYGAEIKVTEKMRNFLKTIGVFLKKETKMIIIPARPFTRKAFDGGRKNLVTFVEKMHGKLINGKINANVFMNSIGVFHSGQIKASIGNGSWKKNSQLTIEQKKSSTPLIDTGEMINGVKYKIGKAKDADN